MKISSMTGTDNYFEDFVPGTVMKHHRGRTIDALENITICNLVMNTAQSHFNEHQMAGRGVVVFGGVTISMVIGLAAQDTAENALAELSLDKIRLKSPVSHGDTLYAYSKVLDVTDSDQEDAGIVTFKHWGINQDEKTVFEGERRVLIKRRSHWGDR